MTEEHITFATAKLAKEKGFDDKHCVEYYDRHGFIQKTITNSPNAYRRPTQSFLQKWLREKHKLHCTADCNASGWAWFLDKTNGTSISGSEFDGPNDGGRWNKYEDALEVGLQQTLIKYLKKDEKNKS